MSTIVEAGPCNTSGGPLILNLLEHVACNDTSDMMCKQL